MLHQIQAEIKAPKGQFNKFGNYKYRSCEDIVEAVKPILLKYGFSLLLRDEIVMIGNRFYVKATALIMSEKEENDLSYEATAYAREDETIKGMAAAQITGSASSYARKYALNGLFAIDDTKDADATHGKDDIPFGVENGMKDIPAEGERQLLRDLVYSSDLTPDEVEKAMSAIELCNDYTTYNKIECRLMDRQRGIDTYDVPSQKAITKHIKKITKV